MPERRKPGPKGRGTRSQCTLRLPAEHKAYYQKLADERGLELGQYLTMQLAERHGLDLPDWIPVHDPEAPQQQELRISA